ncbi:5682_t:CDS:2 [Cetraspora pellucida]|uniref:5682_t:CDS:1 n=1 Tax=Cetraspora pellucida TaxID=1433469 RepID=A0ACA9KYY7_9GLOM|nr:5682_t:CDS:2 [Cetraspora pellucida]
MKTSTKFVGLYWMASSKVEEIAYLSTDLPGIRTPTVVSKRKEEDGILTNKIKDPVTPIVSSPKVLLTPLLNKKNPISEIIDLYIGLELKGGTEPSEQVKNEDGLENELEDLIDSQKLVNNPPSEHKRYEAVKDQLIYRLEPPDLRMISERWLNKVSTNKKDLELENQRQEESESLSTA